MNLYEISKDMNTLISVMDEDRINDQDLINAISAVEGCFIEKTDKITKYIKHLEYLADAAKVEKDRLSDLQKSRELKIKTLKNYLINNMELAGYKKIELENFTLSIRENAESVKIEDEEIIPEEFIRVRTVKDVDKILIKDTYQKTGLLPAGVRIERSKSLTIK